MKKQLFLPTKLSIVLGIVLLIGYATQAKAQNNPWGIADTDTIRLMVSRRDFLTISPFVSGRIYNAIDPRYIVDRNGFSIRIIQGEKSKSFRIFHCFFELPDWSPALLWNYYIDDIPLTDVSLVSSLMPQAIEKVAFTPVSDSARPAFSRRPDPETGLWMDKETGIVRVYTRSMPPVSSEENTLYLLNGIAITPKIFQAIRPIYIRSLQRITDRDVLQSFDRSGLKEVVKIETFTIREVEGIFPLYSDKSVLLIDGIELPVLTEHKLKSHFFKKVHRITGWLDRDSDEGFDELEQKFPGRMFFTIITL